MSKNTVRTGVGITDKKLESAWPNGVPTDEEMINMLLKESADYLDGNWIQGDWLEEGNVCAVGALNHVYGTHEKTRMPRRILDAAKIKLANAIYGGKSELYLSDSGAVDEAEEIIIDFNDDCATEERKVVSMFKRAIRRKK